MIPQRIVILGDDEVRRQVREAMAVEPAVQIIGEMCAALPRHIGYIADTKPDVVVLDGTSRTINPLMTIAELRHFTHGPRVILVLAGSSAIDFRTVSRLGVDAVVTTTQALIEAVRGPVRPHVQPGHGIAA